MVGLADGAAQVFGPLALEDGATDGRTYFGHRRLCRLELSEFGDDQGLEAIRLDEVPVGVGGGGKASGNFDAPAAELAHHLPERGVLAADGRHVASPYLLEPAYVVGSHFCLRGIIEE